MAKSVESLQLGNQTDLEKVSYLFLEIILKFLRIS